MNKLFTKIAALALGATMAVGVGVAVASNSKPVEPAGASSPVSLSLSTKTWTEGTNKVIWSITDGSTAVATMESSGTNYKNYLGGDSNNRTSSRFYSGGTVTITPSSGITLGTITFSATSNNYATAFKNSTWTNASASSSSSTVTITPTSGTTTISVAVGGTCGFTAATFAYTSSGGGGGGDDPTPSFTPDHAGTSEDPYSVSDVLGITDSYASTEVDSKMSYVKGVVSSLSSNNADDWGKFDITDGTNEVYCSGVDGSSTDKTSASYVGVGYEVIIHGYLQKYEGDQMVSWDDDSSGSECYLVSSTKATITSFTASVNGTHYANSKLVATDFTTSVSYSGGPQNIAVPETDDLEWMVGEEVDGTLQPGSNTVTVFYWTEDYELTVTGTEIHATDISFSAETYNMGKNTTLTLTPTITPSNTTDTVSWVSSNTSVATVSQSGVVTSGGNTGSTTITATINGHTAQCTVRVKNVVTNADEITLATTEVSGTGYVTFSNKSASNEGHSDAIYGGKIAGGNSSIQLNTNSGYGFVCTSSGGNLKSITIEWESHTISSRSVNIFAKSSSYSSASDLDSNQTKGTQVGSLSYSATANTYNFTDTYTYFGLKANGGALYISKLTVVWESADESKTISSVSITQDPTKMSYAVGETLDVTGMVLTATYVEEDVDPAAVTYKVYDGATEITDQNKYTFTDSDRTTGSKSFTVKAAEDETKTATLTISSITPAYPKQINVTTTASWTDTQTLAQGKGRYTVVFSDASHNVTNLKIGDENTSIEYNSVAISPSALAKDYDGKTIVLKYTDPTTNQTVSKDISVSVTPELSVDSFTGIPEYVVAGSTTETITVAYTSYNGALDSYSVTSSSTSVATIGSVTNTYSTENKTGTLTFTVSGIAQGQANIMVSLTCGQRTESRSASILVRTSAPQPAGGSYTLVENASGVTTGSYIIAAKVGNNYYAVTGAIASGKYGNTQISVTNNVATPGDSVIFTITKSGNNYTIQNGSTYITYSSSTDLGTSQNAYAWTVSDQTSGIRFLSGTTGRAFIYRAGTTNKFGGYSTTNAGNGEYFDLTLFKYTESGTTKTGFDYVNEFVRDNMKMDTISITNQDDTGACLGENGNYLVAKRAWNSMITTYNSEVAEADRENLQEIFRVSFADAYARYMAWAARCGDSAPFTGTTIQSKVNPISIIGSSSDVNVVAIVVITSVVSLTAIGGYFFLRKRREQN